VSGFADPTRPNLPDFTAFATQQLGLCPDDLAPGSPYPGYALTISLETVYRLLNAYSPLLYTLAVYNLGIDTLINYCPDNPPSDFFSKAREKFKVFNFVPGVVTAAADVSTSDTLTVPDYMKNLTLQNLQNLKTPWGRQYLAIMQNLGPLWGIS
jgi:hypothetical protein